MIEHSKLSSNMLLQCSADLVACTEHNADACVKDYVEEVIPRYSDVQFSEHFRMSRSVFEALCEWIAPSLPKERGITVEKKLLSTVWLLGNQESFRSVADRFGFSKGCLHRIICSVCECFTSHQQEVICWPATTTELQRNAESFSARCNFPGVVGLVDGTYINILTPSENGDAYINRKGQASIHLQVICDHELKFIDVFTGYPGSVHDSRVFCNSHIKCYVDNVPPEYHILGGAAYALSQNVIVPFRDNGHLTLVEKRFNAAHSSTRVDVERSIGLLKGKFRRLKMLDMHKITLIPHIIVTSCVLHTFILMQGPLDENEILVEDSNDAPPFMDLNSRPNDAALNKRFAIAHQLL